MRYAYCVLNNKVMIMKKIIVSFLVVAGITAANIGIASDYPAVKSSGLYVDGNIGYGMVRVKNSGYPSSDFNGFAWNFSLGYQFIRYVALEAGYTRFADIKVSPLLGSLETPVQGEDLLVKGIYPFCHDQFELFAKAGYTRLSKSTLAIVNGAATTQDQKKMVPTFGLGGGYNITPVIDLTVQWILTLSQGNGFPATDAFFGGISYKF